MLHDTHADSFSSSSSSSPSPSASTPSSQEASPPMATLRNVDTRVRTWVAERPLVAIGGAVVVGIIAGRLLSRR